MPHVIISKAYPKLEAIIPIRSVIIGESTLYGWSHTPPPLLAELECLLDLQGVSPQTGYSSMESISPCLSLQKDSNSKRKLGHISLLEQSVSREVGYVCLLSSVTYLSLGQEVLAPRLIVLELHGVEQSDFQKEVLWAKQSNNGVLQLLYLK